MRLINELPARLEQRIFQSMKKGKVLPPVLHLVKLLNAIAKNLPSFFGGSADLAGSNKT